MPNKPTPKPARRDKARPDSNDRQARPAAARPGRPSATKARDGASAEPAAQPVETRVPRTEEQQARWLRNTALQLGFIGLAAFAVFSFVSAARKDQRRADCSSTCALSPAYAGRNLLAPDFTLPTLDGQELRLSSYRGKTVILNFWASWCEPCRDEMPSIAKLALAIKDRKDIVLLTVSVDEETSAIRDTLATLWAADDELKKKLGKGEIPFVVMHDPELKVVRDVFGTTMYPETWIIDPKGFIRSRFDGEKDWAGAAALDVVETTNRGAGCLADFQASKPVGSFARLCDRE